MHPGFWTGIIIMPYNTVITAGLLVLAQVTGHSTPLGRLPIA